MSIRQLIRILPVAAIFTAIAITSLAWADGSSEMHMNGRDPAMHNMADPAMSSEEEDTRIVVDFPPAFKQLELRNMRDHLESIQRITQYLGQGNYQAASDIASQRLTRSGMSEHDRHQASINMPKEMLDLGAAMHQAAGEFAIVAQNAEVTNDMTSALTALAEVQNRCVTCHRTYRMK